MNIISVHDVRPFASYKPSKTYNHMWLYVRFYGNKVIWGNVAMRLVFASYLPHLDRSCYILMLVGQERYQWSKDNLLQLQRLQCSTARRFRTSGQIIPWGNVAIKLLQRRFQRQNNINYLKHRKYTRGIQLQYSNIICCF